MVFAWRGDVFSGISNLHQLDQVAQSCYTALAFLLVSVYAFNSHEEELSVLGDCFGLACMISSLVVIAQAWHGPIFAPTDIGRLYYGRGAYIGNPSMSGCFIACTFPFLFRFNIWRGWILIPVVAVFLEHASQPIGVLAVVMGAFVFKKSQWAGKYALIVSGAFWALLLGSGYLWLGEGREFLSTTGRFEMWSIALKNWWLASRSVHWLGFGNGSMPLLFPFWQNLMRQTAPPQSIWDWFWWIHSDVLQTLIEQGIVGCVAFGTMFVCACIEAWKKSASLFASVLGFGAYALFNFPVHLPAPAILGAVLVTMAFKPEHLDNQNEQVNMDLEIYQETI